jgi:peroxiredoxin
MNKVKFFSIFALAMVAGFLFVNLLTTPVSADSNIAVGETAPEFTLTDTNGETHSLSDFRGNYVILEWLNHDCPFVVKHYDTGNMQAMQRQTTEEGMTWLTINSSAPGKQGYTSPEKANQLAEKKEAAPTAILLDPEGNVGRMYDAKVTPHMYVINPEGVLIYDGAIDDKPSTRKADVEGAHNYVMAALNQARAGEEVSTPSTTPYGCTVKY